MASRTLPPLARRFGGQPAASVTPAAVEAFRDELSRDHAPATVNRQVHEDAAARQLVLYSVVLPSIESATAWHTGEFRQWPDYCATSRVARSPDSPRQ